MIGYLIHELEDTMKKSVLACFALLLSTAMFAAEAVLPASVQDVLNQSVFEIVTKKVDRDPLSYEKELPLDRIPYAQRTDKYNPIGTAFLMDNGYLYTAAHVLQLNKKLLQDEFFIRDSKGTTYPIDKVIQFATNRDFVVFTAKNFKPGSGLHFNKNAAVNTTIFTVGNALGEGIVIRNGMLTSYTPEDENGEWQWMRFSAAANPGNSGGPLVDENGNVIGIITMKNSTENLNYALPISELDKLPANAGQVRYSTYYLLPNVGSEKFFHKYSLDINLPADFVTVRSQTYEGLKEQTESFATEKFTAFQFGGEKSFVNTDPSNALNYDTFIPSFPYTMCIAQNQKWSAYSPNEVKEFKLEDNGSVKYGSFLRMNMALIQRPESVSEAELISSPKMYMDYILKANPSTRSVAGERITITSYGEPDTKSTYLDNMGRTWLISLWDIPWADVTLLAYALPLPNGIYVMSVLEQTSEIYNGWNYDVKYLSDFVMPGYVGTVKQWNEYLSLEESVYPRHKVLKDAELTVTKDTVRIKLGQFDLDLPAKVIAAGKDDDYIVAAYKYVKQDDGKLVQEPSAIALSTQRNTDDYHYFMLLRNQKPPVGVSKQVLDNWKKVKNKVAPYNGKPYDDDQNTNCDIVYNITDDSYYWINLELQGSGRKKDMNNYMKAVKKALKIK